MSDHELLELAAKAAGIEPAWGLRLTPTGQVGACGETIYRRDQCIKLAGRNWDPLTDDGDALRLANALKLSTCHTLCESPTAHGTAMVGYAPWEKGAPICSERYDDIEGRDAATRRAITRAAAEIGRTES